MQLKSFTLENFRSYKEPRKIDFGDLTTIIGKNDVGKSTILEALEIFFNNKTVSIDQSDTNVFSESKEVRFRAEFVPPDDPLTLDAGSPTTLREEHLLSADGTLIVERVYDCSRKNVPTEAFIVAQHPTAEGVSDLLEKKERELQKLVKERNLDCPLKGNPTMRQALWAAAGDLMIQEVRVPVSKPAEDSKRIWEQIEARFPVFALFQSDRPSRDTDGEIQNPLNGAVAAAIAEVQPLIEEIQNVVRSKSEEIAQLTHETLKEIDPNLAASLTPSFTPPTPAKWTGLFKLGMETDGAIPLNKRGSGVRRMILVSFFKAQAERKRVGSQKANIIYGIEEPETSQHPRNQRVLTDSFIEISEASGCQVVLTTHSPGLAADLPVNSIRFVQSEDRASTPDIRSEVEIYHEVADALGLTPDSRVKLLLCVEGPTDVLALKALSQALHRENPDLPDLENDPRVAFVVQGGSTLKHWVSENYLKHLGRPEAHIYDNDVQAYQASVDEVNGRTDGKGSWAVLTSKHEIECYLHADAIAEEFGIEIEINDQPGPGSPAVPKAFAQAYSADRQLDGVLKDKTAKQYLSKAFRRMTADRIRERDPNAEVRGWMERIAEIIAR